MTAAIPSRWLSEDAPQVSDGAMEPGETHRSSKTRPPQPSVKARIVIARPQELPEVFRFRYRVYVKEMQRQQRYANHALQQTTDELDAHGVNLMAVLNGSIVGTARVNFLEDGRVGSYEDFYELDKLSPAERHQTSITTSLIVDQSLRSSSLPLMLVRACYRTLIERDSQLNLIDCNDHLVPFFRRLGYQSLGQKTHYDYGRVNRMSLELQNEAQLAQARSPFLRMLRSHRAAQARDCRKAL